MTADILDRVASALDGMEAEGRTPQLLLLGHLEAAELEAALYRPARTEYGVFGEVLFELEACAPELPLDVGHATLFGVRVQRVDQATLIVVVAEDGPTP